MATTDEPAKPRASKATSAKVARRYLEALSRHDLDAAVACWAPGGRDRIHGQVDAVAPEGVRDYFGGLIAAFPDLRLEELSCTAEGERCTIRSRMTGTFAGEAPWNGIAPNGARIDLEIVDNFVVGDGLLVDNDAYLDGLTVARQLGLLPPDGSTTQRRMERALNAKTRLTSHIVAAPEEIAEGVWVLRGGIPTKEFNVFLLADDDGVTVFDAAISAMAPGIVTAAIRLGGIRRVVLGHAHPDHRGAAPGLGAPVLCHPADRADAEGDGGVHYFDYGKLNPLSRVAYPRLLRMWDGGPVDIAGTVEEGDEVAGFRVVHIPGHSPGLIALWRESDRLALVSDGFYTLDPQTSRRGGPRVPLAAFNLDTEQARASLRKLAALEPAAAWPGHAEPVTGDVRAQLEHAAATT